MTKLARHFRCQRWALLLLPAVALVIRWPATEFAWQHMDESVFFTLPLEFWSGDLNPGFFNYPALQFYLTSLVYLLYFALFSSESTNQFLAYHYFIEAGPLIAVARGLTTVMAAGTTIAVMKLGSRLYGAAGGIGAGAAIAVMPLHVRFSHLATSDAPAALWTTLAVLFSVRLVQSKADRDALLAGAFAGLAAGTKYPAALCVVPVATAVLLGGGPQRWGRLVLSAGSCLLCFALATPYVILDFQGFWHDFHTMGQEHIFDYIHVHRGSTWSYHLSLTLRHGLGLLPMFVCAVALAWKPRSWRPEEIVVGSAVLAFGSLLVFPSSVFVRYALPLAPLLAILMIRPLAATRRHPALFAAAILILLAEPAHASWNTRRLLSSQDTRAQAAAWIHQNLTDGERLWSPPDSAGRVRLLNPRELYLKHQSFARRFGADRLRRCYRLLLDREHLPAIHATGDPGDLGPLFSTPATAVDSATVLLYRHSLQSGQSTADADMLTNDSELLIEFSPGSWDQATFDWVDWYFLPLAGWEHLTATGPTIEVRSAPVAQRQQRIPGLRAFLAFLDALLEANQMRSAGNWEGILNANEALLATPFDLQDFLAPPVLYALHFDLAAAYAKRGRHEDSIPHWQTAIAVAPLADAFIGLGAAYLRLEMPTKAAHSFERALALAPDHPRAVALRAQVRALAGH